MKILSWDEFNKETFYISVPSGVAIGVFDGVHRGHKYLLDRIIHEYLYEKIVFTFRQNPFSLLNREKHKGDIYTLDQKLDALKMAGVTTTVLIDFSGDFSKLSGKYFLLCIAGHLNLKKIAAGADFKCGSNNDTNTGDLIKIFSGKNIEVEIIKRIRYDNIPVSSSIIRDYIYNGKLSKAEKLLEYGFSVNLNDTRIFEDGSYDYAMRKDIIQILPQNGNYMMNVRINNVTSKKDVIIDNKTIKWLKTSEQTE